MGVAPGKKNFVSVAVTASVDASRAPGFGREAHPPVPS